MTNAANSMAAPQVRAKRVGGDVVSELGRTHYPWHEGELALQREARLPDDFAVRAAAAVRDYLLQQHRLFFSFLPFVIIGAVDPEGAPWATIQAGTPGFLSTPDPFTLQVDVRREPADPADRGMEDGDAVGLLGIEMPTRRRSRLNGVVRRDRSESYAVTVKQSFGNCQRFIWPRQPVLMRAPEALSGNATRRSDRLDAHARMLVAAADTFFVASYADCPGDCRQADVSHRGGPVRFVQVDAEGVLTIPDRDGNGFFNTLGNIRTNGRAGLLFIDFATGDLLQVTGDAEVLQTGRERKWRVRPRQVVFRPDAVLLQWDVPPPRK